MEHCSKKIEELLKDMIYINSENDENNYLMKRLLNNVIQIVKLANRLSLNCLYKNELDIITNNIEIKDLKNDILKIIFDLLLYSSNDKTKNILKISSENNFSILQNNYHIISSTLEDIFSRSNDCFRFFDIENKNKSIFTCKYLKNLSYKNVSNIYNNNLINENVPLEKEERISIKSQSSIDEEKEKEKKKKKKKKKHKKMLNLNELEEKKNNSEHKEIINISEDEEDDNKEEIKNNNIYNEVINIYNDKENKEEKNNFKNIINTEDENEDEDEKKENCYKNNLKKNFESVKKNIDKNSKKNKNMLAKKNKKEKDYIKKKDILTFKDNLYKIQNSWIHLTNNYAKFFIPRILFKYNKLIDLDEILIEAVKIQEYYIEKKKLLLHYKECFRNNELKYNSSEIIDKIFNDNEINEILKIKKEENDHINSNCSLESSSILKYNGIMDEEFFSKMLNKLHKDINKYYYRFNNLRNPYEYEINNMIELYKKSDKDILKFLNVKYELTVPLGINEKKYEIIDNKDDLIKLIKIIKLEYDKISIMVKINYKNSYRGFTSLILIGTKDVDYIIDVFNMFEDIFLLNEITTDSKILKITYDSKNVILFLQRDFSVYLVNVIDILICSNYLNLKNSLSNLVYNYFNVSMNNIRSYSNFLTRPLTPDIINILRNTFHYLYYLFDYVKTDLYFNYIFNNYKNEVDTNFKQEDLNNYNRKIITTENTNINEIINMKDFNDKKNIINNEDSIGDNTICDNDIINKKNIYVNFEKIKFYDLSEHEKKYGDEIIKKVFVDSNTVCLTKHEITDVCDIIKTSEQIKKIIKNSYNSICSDNLINNILIWREKLSKKVDESPDNIINIHNIISIILNMPSSISSLKNNIVPLSNIISENIETLFEIITKTNMKKPNSHFYLNYIQNDTTNNNMREEITPIKYYMNNKKINNENYKDSIILPNLYFQKICQEEKTESKEKNSNQVYNRNIIQDDQQNISYISKKGMFALEKTFFSESEDDNKLENKNNDNNKKNENYVLLSSLINSMKERNEKMSKLNQNKSNEKIKTDVATKKTIVKNKKNNNIKNRKKNKIKSISYNQQYNIKRSKINYSKNILDEIN
ncbi:exosome complex exonuclease RRP6, putative [Plasmodium gallinaceum]|uniref:Exosome complex exonuclease RRP6, putative n=1 Tax=Plasmodium gallinaceum TaxID=5849 RepID=A0A1J1GQZ9_PLAGA|nr:exosome complex exonuclease RRP6, putative [Plasmodium gallinaceum]CRG94692.1 exosome complex exonuclease RRP6, putative [Plasmodium gallinaceum]